MVRQKDCSLFNGLTFVAWVPGCPDGTKPIDLVMPDGQLSAEVWEQIQDVLKSVYRTLSMTFSRMWMGWHPEVLKLLAATKEYSNQSEAFDANLMTGWMTLLESSVARWDEIVNSPSIVSEDLDAWDGVEQDVTIGDDDPIIRDDITEIEYQENDTGNIEIE